jgi:hypothetical protein
MTRALPPRHRGEGASLIPLPLYFLSPTNHFNRKMTRHFFRLLVLALAGLPMAQISSRADTTGTAPVKSAVLEGNVAYLRVGQVEKNLADEIHAAQGALAVSNQIAGAILDLRFADGGDSDSAKSAAVLFESKKTPLAILVNDKTRGEAAALAAELRAARAGLVFEGIAGPSQTNAEINALVQPDIAVAIGAEDERVLMENPYAAPAQNDTNSPAATNNLLPFMDHMNHTSEADLVRAKIKDGDEDGNTLPPPQAGPPRPVIHDPVLARAVDLIKGLAIVRAPRP